MRKTDRARSAASAGASDTISYIVEYRLIVPGVKQFESIFVATMNWLFRWNAVVGHCGGRFNGHFHCFRRPN
ncbi:MAG: hypothetical protein ACYTEX_20635 [Planctomycetota bacterium]